MTEIVQIPQDEGELSPREVRAWQQAQLNETNLAGNESKAAQALKLVQGVMQEREEKMRGLHRRWRAIYHMLAGNTLEKGGPEDVHSPELYKAAETLVPRIEEQVIGQEPWFKAVPVRRVNRDKAAVNEAYLDWEFRQAKIRDMIQPTIRDMLFTQVGTMYVDWHCKETWRNEREIVTTIEGGRQKKKVKITKKKKVDYYGPRARLIDPFDFIIDSKAKSPQDATFVGHRAYLTIDEIRTYGRLRGWKNLDRIGNNAQQSTVSATSSEFWSWPRDPASRYQTRFDQTQPSPDARPQKHEVVFLYTKAAFDEAEDYDDYLIVIVNGTTVVELTVNPLDGQYRPYACFRSGKSGHEFYSIGTFDNAVRMNQHLDAQLQIFAAGARLAGSPMGFAEDDSDLPDSLYKIRPGQILKGVGNIRFTQIPDGFLRAAPLITGMWQKNIEEVVGAFRINMGQDTGGTATEASLSLQEGNRRTRGLIRAVGEGLEQLLQIFHKMNKQFSVEDIEFPVLGKRALSMRRETANIGPADLLEDVEFELVGLRNSRNYGMKATGYQALLNGGMPLIVANSQSVDTLVLLHDLATELVGPEEADRYIKLPTPIEQLRSQHEENDMLLAGVEVEVDPEDDDKEHLRDERFRDLFQRAKNPDSGMHLYVREAILKHAEAHMDQAMRKLAQEGVRKNRMQRQQPMPGSPEAGGIASPETGAASPKAGGFSNAVEELSTGPPGQAMQENPGPPDTRKSGRGGRRSQMMNQSENML